MKITLAIDSKEYLEISNSDLANFAVTFDDEARYASFYAQLARHPASEVRGAVADKYWMPIESIEILARDASIEVVQRVANNERALQLFDASLLMEMIERDVSIAVEIADNLTMVHQDIQEELAEKLMKHSDPRVAELVARYEQILDSKFELQE